MESHIYYCNPRKTSIQTVALVLDRYGVPFSEKWEYVSIMGMLMFLYNDSRSEIAYAVHQCAIFNHCPKSSHGATANHIIR